MCIIQWLNANAPALQAIATVVLAIITAIYVALTGSLARAARDQMHALEETKLARWYQLDSLLEKHLLFLDKVPDRTKFDSWMRDTLLPRTADIGLLSNLGSEFIGSSKLPALLEDSLEWIRYQLEEKKRIPPLQGVKWDQFPFDEFFRRVDKCKEAIRQMKSAMDHWYEKTRRTPRS